MTNDLISSTPLPIKKQNVLCHHLKNQVEQSVFCCIGVAGGAQAGDDASDSLQEEQYVGGLHGVLPVGRGSHTMTMPTI
ncbi:metalloenzyme, LuxS/M16 peptidase-like protein [Artemisia annua]|uniref:Metalloenzyme, LuxS/M16 peptidase-like protein n=1 Tax=Artemisia annua TaxID=35608 RepID=A0A2U1NUL7_ARTAN|nr:metalloenzyme, LuxS/M16 peptidase-like protein [Artemisia annua]